MRIFSSVVLLVGLISPALAETGGSVPSRFASIDGLDPMIFYHPNSGKYRDADENRVRGIGDPIAKRVRNERRAESWRYRITTTSERERERERERDRARERERDREREREHLRLRELERLDASYGGRHDRRIELEGTHCLPMQYTVGESHLRIETSRNAADAAWAIKIRFLFGERYMDMANAQDRRYSCSQSSTTDDGVAAKVEAVVGAYKTRCAVEARPCLPRLKEGERNGE